MRYEWQVIINGGTPIVLDNMQKAIEEFRFHERQLGVSIKLLELKRVEKEDK